MSAAKSKKSSSRSSHTKAASNSFFANYVTVVFILAGTVAIGSSTFNYIQRLFPASCQTNAGFNCVYGPFEIANVLGVILFLTVGYWLLGKCLRIASFKRLVFGGLVAMILFYVCDRYLFNQMNIVTSDTPHGFYYIVLWSREIVVTLLGAVAVFVPFHMKSK